MIPVHYKCICNFHALPGMCVFVCPILIVSLCAQGIIYSAFEAKAKAPAHFGVYVWIYLKTKFHLHNLIWKVKLWTTNYTFGRIRWKPSRKYQTKAKTRNFSINNLFVWTSVKKKILICIGFSTISYWKLEVSTHFIGNWFWCARTKKSYFSNEHVFFSLEIHFCFSSKSISITQWASNNFCFQHIHKTQGEWSVDPTPILCAN